MIHDSYVISALESSAHSGSVCRPASWPDQAARTRVRASAARRYFSKEDAGNDQPPVTIRMV
ncbi:hypothetical protein A4R35_23165 [Thermogemmatispora tikiterensis]|uniref:Uncharacterized protein n=1 Tax=Thermogemmatispora tikiterensis TaxID=1825093 RepID=A0A328VNK3_9CHLR|nr:hypothetical protein A4R35_23165 [Thermogemmatispora tikiterensis]